MHVCNPYCGRCKPPKEPLRVCPTCGAYDDSEHSEHGTCKECGGILPPRVLPQPLLCKRINQMCARPCKQGEKPPRTPVASCRYHTPL